jgi:hypothetical protein
MSKADDVLFVLNELEPVDMDELKFCVITAGSRQVIGMGPMAGQIIQLPEGEERFTPFEKAEILVVVGDYGREPFGEGRAPRKWAVDESYFGTLEEAQACRAAVLDGTWDRETYLRGEWRP